MNYKVSVCITTFNQEQFIRDTILSVIKQAVDFNFEIIVSDDCSKDNTRDILQEIKDEYKHCNIVLVFNKVNVGGELNFINTHKLARGEYVCILDGDDMMLPGKLQKQVDFMDCHKSCNLCFHRVKYLYSNGTILDDFFDSDVFSNGFTRRDIISFMAVACHSSKMYRNGTLSLPNVDFTISDYYMNILQVGESKAYYVAKEPLGVYRVGVGQSNSSKNKMFEMIYLTIRHLYEKFPEDKNQINIICLHNLLKSMKRKDYSLFVRFFLLLSENFHVRIFKDYYNYSQYFHNFRTR
jgi:glycosyltransferase involved in cell wall biosynthesis